MGSGYIHRPPISIATSFQASSAPSPTLAPSELPTRRVIEVFNLSSDSLPPPPPAPSSAELRVGTVISTVIR